MKPLHRLPHKLLAPVRIIKLLRVLDLAKNVYHYLAVVLALVGTDQLRHLLRKRLVLLSVQFRALDLRHSLPVRLEISRDGVSERVPVGHSRRNRIGNAHVTEHLSAHVAALFAYLDHPFRRLWRIACHERAPFRRVKNVPRHAVRHPLRLRLPIWTHRRVHPRVHKMEHTALDEPVQCRFRHFPRREVLRFRHLVYRVPRSGLTAHNRARPRRLAKEPAHHAMLRRIRRALLRAAPDALELPHEKHVAERVHRAGAHRKRSRISNGSPVCHGLIVNHIRPVDRPRADEGCRIRLPNARNRRRREFARHRRNALARLQHLVHHAAARSVEHVRRKVAFKHLLIGPPCIPHRVYARERPHTLRYLRRTSEQSLHERVGKVVCVGVGLRKSAFLSALPYALRREHTPSRLLQPGHERRVRLVPRVRHTRLVLSLGTRRLPVRRVPLAVPVLVAPQKLRHLPDGHVLRRTVRETDAPRLLGVREVRLERIRLVIGYRVVRPVRAEVLHGARTVAEIGLERLHLIVRDVIDRPVRAHHRSRLPHRYRFLPYSSIL